MSDTLVTEAQIETMFDRLTSTMRAEMIRELSELQRAEHHNECLVDLDTATMSNEPLGAPAVPQLAWFESLPEFADPRNMAGVILCGADKGRFWTMIGEADVPYMSGYDGIEAPIADASTSYYMNERLENPLLVADASGAVVEIAAGPIGFGHSPDSIMTVDGVYEWHDREWGEAAKERVIARARLFEVDGPEGRVVVAAGALMPDVTWGEALAVMNSEVSPEFMGVFDDASDDLVGIEWVTQTLVFQGNTRTSKSTDARVGRSSVRAELRCVRGSVGQVARVRRAVKGLLPVSSGKGAMMETIDDVVAAAKAAGLDLAELRKACGATPCGPCAAKAAEDEGDGLSEVDQAAADALAEMTAERDALLNEQYDAMQIDTTPVKAAINTHSELRDAVSAAVYARYDTDTTYSWVIDFMIDGNEVVFEVDSAEGPKTWRQSFTLDTEAHTAELSGEPVQIARETQYIDL